MLTALRRTARTLGGIVAALFLVHIIGEGFPAPSLLTIRDSFAVVGVTLSIIGLLLAWKWEGPGGALAILGYVVAAISHTTILASRVFGLLALTGILFLVCWWLTWKQSGAEQLSLPNPLSGLNHKQRRVAGYAGGILLLLFTNEVFLTPPIMSTGVNILPTVAGHWEGRSSIVSGWCNQRRLKVAVTVHDDGAVDGSVGDAALEHGRFAANRTWIGKLLGWRSEYLITGELAGMIVAPESIARAEVKIPVTMTGTRLLGGVTALGGGTDNRGMLQSTWLSLFRPGPERTITFRVRPESFLDAGRIYITGDNDQLGNWEPAGAALNRQSDGTFTGTFRFPEGMIIHFNCTRGSWKTQAQGSDGSALPNRTLEVMKDSTIDINVANWADIIM